MVEEADLVEVRAGEERVHRGRADPEAGAPPHRPARVDPAGAFCEDRAHVREGRLQVSALARESREVRVAPRRVLPEEARTVDAEEGEADGDDQDGDCCRRAAVPSEPANRFHDAPRSEQARAQLEDRLQPVQVQVGRHRREEEQTSPRDAPEEQREPEARQREEAPRQP